LAKAGERGRAAPGAGAGRVRRVIKRSSEKIFRTRLRRASDSAPAWRWKRPSHLRKVLENRIIASPQLCPK
jgi:hypothetical protein